MANSLFKKFARLLIGFAVAGLVIWLFYYDSHSILDRLQWQREYEELVEQNEELKEEIEQLQVQLENPPADTLIERIAREEYGMHKPGETVYRLPAPQE